MQYQLTLAILFIYLGVLITIGLITSRKIKTSNSFFLADRRLSLMPLTTTITATAVGGSATIATAKLIYLYGLPSLWLDIGAATGLIVLGLTLAKKVRKTKLYTLPEITNYLFDKKVRNVSSILVFLTQIAWVALLIQGAGAVISVLLPLDYLMIVTLITAIFILYTVIGGQFAVVYTDIIQFIVMIVGVCFIAAPLIYLKAAPILGEISLNKLSFPVNANYGIIPIVSLFFMMLMPHIVGPDIYSKILSAKEEKTAKYGSIFSGMFRIIFAVSIGIIAVSAIVLIPDLPVEKAVFAMPMAITKLGPFLGGIILAAFISVMLSSADSILVSAGTIFSVDITKKNNIKISRIGIITVGFLALILALYLDDIIQTLTLAYTIFTAGLTLPIIFGFYKEKTKVTSLGALISLISGGLISIVWFFLDNPYQIDAIIVGLIASLIPLLIFRGENFEKRDT